MGSPAILSHFAEQRQQLNDLVCDISKQTIVRWGSDLTPADYAKLAARWISPEVAEAAGLRRVDSLTGRDIVGRRNGDCSGILIRNRFPGANSDRGHRIRLDHPPLEQSRDGQIREGMKYLQPAGRPNLAYFPPVSTDCLADVSLPLIITEGEFKCLALWRLAQFETEQLRGLPVAFSGVWGWRGTVGKTTGPSGERLDVKGPISDLTRIPVQGRRVIIAYDADTQTNNSAHQARAELAKELVARGAVFAYLTWPIEEGKGIDDRLAKVGPARVLADIKALDYTDWRARLLRSDNGKWMPCHENVALYLEHSPEWHGVLAYNEFTGGHVVRREPPAPVSARPLEEIEDHFDTEVVRYFERQYLMAKPEVVRRVVDQVARQNSFHPVRDYLKALQWDGVRRIESWLVKYCGVEASDEETNRYARAVGAKFLISAAARIFEPGCKVDHVLVLEGEQGIGKSEAARILGGEWFTDQLGDLGSKDTSMQLRGKWIIEFGELNPLSRPEIARVKHFLSQQEERFRLPYGKRNVTWPRQCVFIGTTNDDQWLRDETGGRRFWPVRCFRIDREALREDRDQLWAEAVQAYRNGEKWHLEDQDIIRSAKEEQRARYQEDPWHPVIEEWIENRDAVSLAHILGHLKIPMDRWEQTHKNRIAKCLKSLGWERKLQRTQNGREWLYYPPDGLGERLSC